MTAVLVLGSVAALVYAVWCGQSSTKYSPLDTAGIEMVDGEDFGSGAAVDSI